MVPPIAHEPHRFPSQATIFSSHLPCVAFPVECRSVYHEKNTERCLQCKEPVASEKGKFSGEFFELEGGGRIHAECYDAYEEATADRCLVCKKAVRRMEGFSGDFMVVEGGKVHKVGG